MRELGEEAEILFGSMLFDHIFMEFCEGSFEMEIGDLVQEMAVKAGMVERVDFDPEQHTDESGACEPGDDFFQLTEAGRVFRLKGRALASSNGSR